MFGIQKISCNVMWNLSLVRKKSCQNINIEQIPVKVSVWKITYPGKQSSFSVFCLQWTYSFYIYFYTKTASFSLEFCSHSWAFHAYVWYILLGSWPWTLLISQWNLKSFDPDSWRPRSTESCRFPGPGFVGCPR